MQINTQIFRRILTEHTANAVTKIRRAAVSVISDTMEETVRFGTFDREYVEMCAEARLEQALIEE